MAVLMTQVPKVRLYSNIRALRDPLTFLENVTEKHQGGVVSLQLRPGFAPYLVGDPDLVQQVWHGSRETYLRKGMMWEVMDRLQGTSGIASEGEAWRLSHDVLMPIFTGPTIRAMIPTIAAAVNATLDDLAVRADQPVRLVSEMMEVTHRVFGATFFGSRMSVSQARQVSVGIDASFRAIQSRIAVPGAPDWFPMPGDRRFRQLRAMVDSVVYPVAKRARLEPASTDVISLLAHATDAAGDHVDIELVRNNLVGLSIAGTETTALTLTWALIALAGRPEIAARVQSEVDTVVGHGQRVTPEHLDGLAYTEMVLNETLRLWPPGWMLPRGVVQADVLDGVPMVPGDTVIVSPYLTQRMASLWPDPHRFDPERWAPDAAKQHPYAWFPFGGGVHRCLGRHFFAYEAKLALAAMLARFDVRVDAPKGVAPMVSAALKPRHPVWLHLTPR
ncbi:cytochrome P450 [Dactylosporangium siamense]|uniref:Cytochrome P450 n=2 Tax=Dactylosporangium siamense TaxID=685454 RepID=A0A919UH44_9ACTN|nr:cytochrome P450 [Dactylosporangium siamense]